jgi:homoserine kinase type II
VAQFTSLDPARVAAIARLFGLRVDAVAPLAAGTINSNFRLETDRGRVFLRVNEGKSRDEVAYEAALVAYLADGGVATPRPLAAGDGAPFADLDGLLVTLFPWAPGAHHDPPARADCAAVGRALARLHSVGRGFPDRRPSRYARARIEERARGLAGAPAHVAPAVADVRAELAALAGWDPPIDGIIHGDLFPDNVLFTVDRAGGVGGVDGAGGAGGGAGGAVLIDFEQASGGSFVYDLAVVLLSWCWDGRRLLPERARALVGAYGPVDDEALFAAARFAAARFTTTRLTDVELDPRVVDPAIRASKDYREFWTRLRVLRDLGAAGLAAITR